LDGVKGGLALDLPNLSVYLEAIFPTSAYLVDCTAKKAFDEICKRLKVASVPTLINSSRRRSLSLFLVVRSPPCLLRRRDPLAGSSR
jgi:hypothetical protein